jgi:hypothetical protein
LFLRHSRRERFFPAGSFKVLPGTPQIGHIAHHSFNNCDDERAAGRRRNLDWLVQARALRAYCPFLMLGTQSSCKVHLLWMRLYSKSRRVTVALDTCVPEGDGGSPKPSCFLIEVGKLKHAHCCKHQRNIHVYDHPNFIADFTALVTSDHDDDPDTFQLCSHHAGRCPQGTIDGCQAFRKPIVLPVFDPLYEDAVKKEVKLNLESLDVLQQIWFEIVLSA